MNNKNHIEFSKIIATLSMIIFATTLLTCLGVMFYLIIVGQVGYTDFAVLTAAITVTGTVYAATAKFYYQKSGLQNCIQIKKSFYGDVMDIRVKYAERMLKLEQKYHKSSFEMEQDSPFVQMSEDAMNSIIGNIEENENINTREIEV